MQIEEHHLIKKIAVTGGIGSGKTAVTDYLAERGYTVIDADIISHRITASGGSAIPYIREHFGEKSILPDGSMDRKYIRSIVYRDRSLKAVLERGTTDAVVKETKNEIEAAGKRGEKIVFAAIPLLFEYGCSDGEYDEVWLVTASKKNRIQRVEKRDGLEKDEIERIMANQMPDEEKSKLADVVIDNSGTLEDLHHRIENELERLGF